MPRSTARRDRRFSTRLTMVSSSAFHPSIEPLLTFSLDLPRNPPFPPPPEIKQILQKKADEAKKVAGEAKDDAKKEAKK